MVDNKIKLMEGKEILRLKRTANLISTEEDLTITEDTLLNLSRKIFVHHYGKKYEKSDLSVYLTGSYTHPEYTNVTVNPHFVRDDGVIIYLQLVQNGTNIRTVSEDLIHVAMDIIKTKMASIFTITLSPKLNINSDISKILLPDCYQTIREKKIKFDPNISKNYLLSLSTTIRNKKMKIADNNSNNNNNNKMNNNENIVMDFVRNEWVSASKTRNYALRDTLIDWLDYWYDKSPEKEKFARGHISNNTGYDFPKFLMSKGTFFENNVVELIKKKVKPQEFVTICKEMRDYDKHILEYESKTIEEMKKGTPIIYQAVLMNRSGPLAYSFGMPDLLVRSDYISKIMVVNPLDKKMVNYKAPNLTGNYHYVVIDIKFTTLELCADGERLRNSGSIPAYKCQLYIYNHALGKIQGYEPTGSYILGRRFKYESKGKYYYGNSCFARCGHIQYDSWDHDYVSEAVSAIQWIKNLRGKGKEWKLLPKPTVPELYPNMSSTSDTPWDEFKNEYAKKIGEITLLWNCGVKNREIAHQNGVYSYWDTNCNSQNVGINGPKQAPILNEIIRINKKNNFKNSSDRVLININPNINNQWMEPYKLRISVDFETINCIFDDCKNLPMAQDENYLFMIGLAYKIPNRPTEYKMFLLSELSKDAEFQIIYQFYKFLRDLTDKYVGIGMPIPQLYHWGHIERSFFTGLCSKLEKSIGSDIEPDIDLMKTELQWFDLSECFKNNPIVINGCFKFGLKEIAGRLSELGLIQSSWQFSNSSCSNGNMAMIMAQKAYQMSKQMGTPIVQNPIMKEIMEYNKIDCMVIHEIIDFIKKKAIDDGLMDIDN